MGRTESYESEHQEGPEVALPVTLAIAGGDEHEGSQAQYEGTRCPQTK
jgi:hypothetical protein